MRRRMLAIVAVLSIVLLLGSTTVQANVPANLFSSSWVLGDGFTYGSGRVTFDVDRGTPKYAYTTNMGGLSAFSLGLQLTTSQYSGQVGSSMWLSFRGDSFTPVAPSFTQLESSLAGVELYTRDKGKLEVVIGWLDGTIISSKGEKIAHLATSDTLSISLQRYQLYNGNWITDMRAWTDSSGSYANPTLQQVAEETGIPAPLNYLEAFNNPTSSGTMHYIRGSMNHLAVPDPVIPAPPEWVAIHSATSGQLHGAGWGSIHTATSGLTGYQRAWESIHTATSGLTGYMNEWLAIHTAQATAAAYVYAWLPIHEMTSTMADYIFDWRPIHDTLSTMSAINSYGLVLQTLLAIAIILIPAIIAAWIMGPQMFAIMAAVMSIVYMAISPGFTLYAVMIWAIAIVYVWRSGL